MNNVFMEEEIYVKLPTQEKPLQMEDVQVDVDETIKTVKELAVKQAMGVDGVAGCITWECAVLPVTPI